jgi:cytochrome P450
MRWIANKKEGRHVCPGRHLALCVVKLMTIEFMNHYDWKEMQRPEDVPFGPSLGPNPRAKITIKQIG